MTKKDLISKVVAQSPDLNRGQVALVINQTLQAITETLRKEQEVSIKGFGKFELRHRKARKGTNPRTHQPMELSASTTVGFRASDTLKRTINGEA